MDTPSSYDWAWVLHDGFVPKEKRLGASAASDGEGSSPGYQASILFTLWYGLPAAPCWVPTCKGAPTGIVSSKAGMGAPCTEEA